MGTTRFPEHALPHARRLEEHPRAQPRDDCSREDDDADAASGRAALQEEAIAITSCLLHSTCSDRGGIRSERGGEWIRPHCSRDSGGGGADLAFGEVAVGGCGSMSRERLGWRAAVEFFVVHKPFTRIL
jgi:hypothetical protein